MFGLGWTLGLAATSVPVKEFSLTFQILFSIFVGAQGVLIFLLHGVRNQDIRKLWKKWFKTVGSKSHLSTIISSFLTSEVGRAGGDSDLSILPSKKDASAPANIYFQKPAVAESDLYVSVTLKGSSEGKDKQEEEKEPSQKQEMESSHKEEESLQKKEKESLQEEGKECSQKDEKESSQIEEKRKLPEEESSDKGESHEEKSQKEIRFITVDKIDDGSK